MAPSRRFVELSKQLARSRRTKSQVAALVIITVLSFGPVVALVAVVGSDAGPSVLLLDGQAPPEDGAHVVIALTSVSPTDGTMTAQVQIEPQSKLVDSAGLIDELVLRVNDARGDSAIVFPAEQPVRAVTVTLPLRGSSISRYPFDRYQSAVLMSLEQRGEPRADPVNFTVDLSTQLNDFAAVLDPSAEDRRGAAPSNGIAFELSRAPTTTVYTVGVMFLMWSLALAGVAIVWAVTIWGIDTPFWAVGYLVGVLFALPPLRNSLPGSPPPGTLLDFVAFYWSVGLVGLTLITVMGVWLQRMRPSTSTHHSDEGS